MLRATTVLLALASAPALLGGCAALVGSATASLASNLERSITDQDDPATVRDGAPAYLLMLDGLIEGDPESQDLLLSGASLYGAYAGAFVEEPERARRLTARSLDYASRAVCAAGLALCAALDAPFADFEAALADAQVGDVDLLYGIGSAWAGWIQARSDDWAAVADLPKIESVMRRVVELDDAYDGGSAHLVLGVLLTLRPAALGGKPEEGRAEFERAIELSEGRNLMAKVMYAESYARLVFDRELHDRLLEEVLEADPAAPGLTLANVLAQEQARRLLDDSEEYF